MADKQEDRPRGRVQWPPKEQKAPIPQIAIPPNSNATSSSPPPKDPSRQQTPAKPRTPLPGSAPSLASTKGTRGNPKAKPAEPAVPSGYSEMLSDVDIAQWEGSVRPLKKRRAGQSQTPSTETANAHTTYEATTSMLAVQSPAAKISTGGTKSTEEPNPYLGQEPGKKEVFSEAQPPPSVPAKKKPTSFKSGSGPLMSEPASSSAHNTVTRKASAPQNSAPRTSKQLQTRPVTKPAASSGLQVPANGPTAQESTSAVTAGPNMQANDLQSTAPVRSGPGCLLGPSSRPTDFPPSPKAPRRVWSHLGPPSFHVPPGVPAAMRSGQWDGTVARKSQQGGMAGPSSIAAPHSPPPVGQNNLMPTAVPDFSDINFTSLAEKLITKEVPMSDLSRLAPSLLAGERGAGIKKSLEQFMSRQQPFAESNPGFKAFSQSLQPSPEPNVNSSFQPQASNQQPRLAVTPFQPELVRPRISDNFNTASLSTASPPVAQGRHISPYPQLQATNRLQVPRSPAPTPRRSPYSTLYTQQPLNSSNMENQTSSSSTRPPGRSGVARNPPTVRPMLETAEQAKPSQNDLSSKLGQAPAHVQPSPPAEEIESEAHLFQDILGGLPFEQFDNLFNPDPNASLAQDFPGLPSPPRQPAEQVLKYNPSEEEKAQLKRKAQRLTAPRGRHPDLTVSRGHAELNPPLKKIYRDDIDLFFYTFARWAFVTNYDEGAKNSMYDVIMKFQTIMDHSNGRPVGHAGQNGHDLGRMIARRAFQTDKQWMLPAIDHLFFTMQTMAERQLDSMGEEEYVEYTEWGPASWMYTQLTDKFFFEHAEDSLEKKYFEETEKRQGLANGEEVVGGQDADGDEDDGEGSMLTHEKLVEDSDYMRLLFIRTGGTSFKL